MGARYGIQKEGRDPWTETANIVSILKPIAHSLGLQPPGGTDRGDGQGEAHVGKQVADPPVKREPGQQPDLGSGTWPVYSPTGHILYQSRLQAGDLWAVPFSLQEMATTGESFPVQQGIRRHSVSNDGTLVYFPRVESGQQLL